MNSYPKVCFKCRMPHILRKEDEVEFDGGEKVVHKNCATPEQIETVGELTIEENQ